MAILNAATLEPLGAMTAMAKGATVDRPAPTKETKIYFIHRADLHTALKKHAIAAEGPSATGKPVTLRTGCQVRSVDASSGTVTLADGSALVADVVIAADGVHSQTRKTVFGGLGSSTVEERPSAASCFRCLIPTAALLGDPETRPLVEEPGKLTEATSPDRKLIFYPCSGGQQTNVLATLPREHVASPSPREGLLRAYAGFARPVRAMLEKAAEGSVSAYELFDLDPLPSWTKGRVALLGDAAHPFSPFLAQGAAQAMEDAVSLSVMLPLGTLAEQVPSRLRLYEECRKERATKIQEMSRVRGRQASGDQGPPPSGNLTISSSFCSRFT